MFKQACIIDMPSRFSRSWGSGFMLPGVALQRGLIDGVQTFNQFLKQIVGSLVGGGIIRRFQADKSETAWHNMWLAALKGLPVMPLTEYYAGSWTAIATCLIT